MVIRINCGFFWVKRLKKLYGIAIFDHYLTNFIGKKYQTCSKKSALFPKRIFAVVSGYVK
jgi:hypothetical protein